MMIVRALILLLSFISLDHLIFIHKHGTTRYPAVQLKINSLINQSRPYGSGEQLLLLPEKYIHHSNPKYLSLYKHQLDQDLSPSLLVRDSSLESIYTFVPEYNAYKELYDSIQQRMCLVYSLNTSLYRNDPSLITIPSWFYRHSSPLNISVFTKCT